ncbi:DegT/DnrJ/EryC1/StrS family aminotransferase [Aureitalea marina]|uniref:Pyridoxal phosphate-dependent aminotransferase n=1 Tax=Aureitalea marina TaxID=930804 RepID=A0A2S7KTJ9_9FLAO|nr:aminotransferase class I/II-fold pyridoxal phosphate-dependent enzyme [Aureitalea marina]PQB05957.1 pyridoxal phosphate-dependent aminotransferase [Aureitalea marina]
MASESSRDNNKKILLSPPSQTGLEEKFLKEVLASNWLAPVGPQIDAFELELSQYLGSNKEVVALNSGTSAIHLALIQCGVGPGDHVICQSFSFAATANPIRYLGAEPIFIDSEQDTWNIDPNVLELALAECQKKGIAPKAIIAVHTYGTPCRLKEILQIASRYEIPVIEDSAEALGSSIGDDPCGTLGDFGVLSFNGNKVITTAGGGALICNDKEQKEAIIALARQAPTPGRHYFHQEIGYNYRMSNLNAALGRAQLVGLAKKLDRRSQIHQHYTESLRSDLGIKLYEVPDLTMKSNYWLNCICCNWKELKLDLEDVVSGLANQNIEVRPFWHPLHLQPSFNGAPYYGNSVAQELQQVGLCLPSGDQMTNSDVDRVVEALHLLITKSASS